VFGRPEMVPVYGYLVGWGRAPQPARDATHALVTSSAAGMHPCARAARTGC